MEESVELTAPSRKGKKRDFVDRATVDKVLDHRATDILYKLMKRGALSNLTGTISSGKEANIYGAMCSTELTSKFTHSHHELSEISEDNTSGCSSKIDSDGPRARVPVVLKIYKTSTNVFKDRERYLAHEKRFPTYSSGNSRKLIKLWAEKEVRNLKRIAKHGILAPVPLYLKNSVLVLSLIGDSQVPAPRLRDVQEADWDELYRKALRIIRRMYQKAGLVHADFSEYNLLYHKEQLYVIDVAQSVECDHENSINFLVSDIKNCNDFFRKKGVGVMAENDLFERITGLKIPSYLRDTALTKDTFIPTRMAEVVNEEDYELFVAKDGNDNGRCSVLDESDDGSEGTDKELNEACCHGKTQEDGYCFEGSEERAGDEDSISLYVRKLSLINSEATMEEAKEYNRKRKAIIKEMNRERRVQRVEKKREIEHKRSKQRKVKR